MRRIGVSKKGVGLLFVLLMFTGCGYRVSWHYVYDAGFGKSVRFRSKCNNLFRYDEVRVDTLSFDKRAPILDFCREDSMMRELFYTRLSLKPYYSGSIRNDLGLELLLLSFKQDDKSNDGDGYLLIRRRDDNEYTLIQTLLSQVDSERHLKGYYRGGYLLLVEKCDHGYDVIDYSKGKEISVNYCVIKLNRDGKVGAIVDAEEGNRIAGSVFKDVSLKNRIERF